MLSSQANYGNGLGIDTPEFNSDSFQEILEYVSKPAPKYRETDDGTFEEVIAEKANIKRPQQSSELSGSLKHMATRRRVMSLGKN